MEDSIDPAGAANPRNVTRNPLRPRLLLLTLATTLAVLLADQLTKWWAMNTLTLHETVPVWGEALQWLLKMNSGAAFSLLSDTTWLFTIISSVVSLIIIVNLRRVQAPIWALVTGLVLGGAVGNLLDRLFREPGFGVGHVVDFIYTPWMMPAIYNVADIAVVSGMILFLLCIVLGVQSDGSRVKRDD